MPLPNINNEPFHSDCIFVLNYVNLYGLFKAKAVLVEQYQWKIFNS